MPLWPLIGRAPFLVAAFRSSNGMTQTAVFSSVRFGRDEPAPQPRRTASPTSVALENLRGIVILIVLAFHAALAYVSFAPPLSDFSSPPFTWRAFPILDRKSTRLNSSHIPLS